VAVTPGCPRCASPSLTSPALTTADTDEFVRTYARPRGLQGAAGLYRSMLTEGLPRPSGTTSTTLTTPPHRRPADQA
jgi:hypothetical protein